MEGKWCNEIILYALQQAHCDRLGVIEQVTFCWVGWIGYKTTLFRRVCYSFHEYRKNEYTIIEHLHFGELP